MKVIGLTGGIASGKSTVTKYIRELGGIVIDADIIARDIVEKGKPALKDIKEQFGLEVINKDGSLKRKALGEIVFNDPKKLKILNQITHFRIINEIDERLKYYRKLDDSKVVFIDAALLIEMKMDYLVDEIWLVIVDKETQIQRLMARDEITYNKALDRINSQMTLEEKKEYADIIIDNSKGFDELEEQILNLWNKFCGGA